MPEINFVGYNPTSLTDPVFPITGENMTIYHRFFRRFYELEQLDRTTNAVLGNDIPNRGTATVSAGTVPSGVTSHGLVMETTDQGALPKADVFDLTTIPADREIVLSTAITAADVQGSSASGIVGLWDAASTIQWAFRVSGDLLVFRLGSLSISSASVTADGTRKLLTAHIGVANGSGVRTASFYVGSTLIGSTTFTPAAQASLTPRIGATTAFQSVTMTMHTLHQITAPAGFDIASWITAELEVLTDDLG